MVVAAHSLFIMPRVVLGFYGRWCAHDLQLRPLNLLKFGTSMHYNVAHALVHYTFLLEWLIFGAIN